MRPVSFTALLLLVSSASAAVVKRASCDSFEGQTCNHKGEEYCCVDEGQIGEFVTCPGHGEQYQFASCTPNPCTQVDSHHVSCDGGD